MRTRDDRGGSILRLATALAHALETETDPALTPAGAATLDRAHHILARLESRWVRRMGEARPGGFPSLRFQALRRWLGEGLAALGGA